MGGTKKPEVAMQGLVAQVIAAEEKDYGKRRTIWLGKNLTHLAGGKVG